MDVPFHFTRKCGRVSLLTSSLLYPAAAVHYGGIIYSRVVVFSFMPGDHLGPSRLSSLPAPVWHPSLVVHMTTGRVLPLVRALHLFRRAQSATMSLVLLCCMLVHFTGVRAELSK